MWDKFDITLDRIERYLISFLMISVAVMIAIGIYFFVFDPERFTSMAHWWVDLAQRGWYK